MRHASSRFMASALSSESHMILATSSHASVGALGGGRVPFRKDQRFVIDVIIIAIGGADPFHIALAWDAIRLEINDMWCGQVLVSARV